MIDTATNTVVATVPIARPVGVAFTSDGAFAYVVNRSSDTVSVLSTATNTITTTIPVGAGPLNIAFLKPQSPQDQIASLIAQVQALVTEGTLTQNKAAGLINKLNQVIAKLNHGQTNAACNQLSSFINQVNAFVNSGALTQAEAQPLINGANAIKASLGC